MSKYKMPNLKEGKLLKEIDFQILMCTERIRNHEKSISTVKKMAGMYGPSGYRSGTDYSGQVKCGVARMGFPDALAAIARDEEYIIHEREVIKTLRKRKKNLIKAAGVLEGLEQQVFVQRVIFALSQDDAADIIGISKRQLQRVEKQISTGLWNL